MLLRSVACVACFGILLSCAEGTDEQWSGAGSAGTSSTGDSTRPLRNDATLVAADLDAAPPTPVGASVPADFRLRLEAEAAELGGDALLGSDPQASGQGTVDLRRSGTITWTIQAPSPGVYALVVAARVPPGSGSKQNYVLVDGSPTGTFSTHEDAAFYQAAPVWVKLGTGSVNLSLRAYWGYTLIDYVELRPVSPAYLAVEPTLVTPNASEQARRLMHYLVRGYGRRTLSGQQDMAYARQIFANTGKYPAVLGLDLIDYSPSRVERAAPPNPGAIEYAIDWYKNSAAIVAMLWHWNAPSGLLNTVYTTPEGRVVDASWYRGFYSDATTFDLSLAMSDPSSAEYGLILRDIDAIAAQLKRLDAAGVPLLWRPLHEASGGWFWWGAHGPDAYLALWNLMFDRLTNYHGLTNLIWVWNGQDPAWYPGDATVDIVSLDIYADDRDYSPQLTSFGAATYYPSSPKMVALSENGVLLDPDALAESGAAWSWFCLWSGSDYVNNSARNESSMFQKVYTSDRIVTLDKLPNMNTYPLP
jgi:mannan endo-1,4-beta-mannosidase